MRNWEVQWIEFQLLLLLFHLNIFPRKTNSFRNWKVQWIKFQLLLLVVSSKYFFLAKPIPFVTSCSWAASSDSMTNKLMEEGHRCLIFWYKIPSFYTTISPCYLCMKEWIRKGWNSALMSFKVRTIHSVKISVIVSCYHCIIFGFFLASYHPFAVIELFSAISSRDITPTTQQPRQN